MTPQEFAQVLRVQVRDIHSANRPLQLASYSCVAAISERAFTRGENEKGEKFQYKSEWYKQEREEKGRRTDFVNWQFYGDLMSDYMNAPLNSPTANATTIKLAPDEYVSRLSRPVNQVKYKSLSEGRTTKKGTKVRGFGEFLKAGKQEENLFYHVLENELRLALEI